MLKYPILILSLFFSTIVIQKQWTQLNLEHPPTYIPPPKYIHYFHFGYNESMSDSFWLRWVQDIDVCGTKKVSRKSVIPDKPVPRKVAGEVNTLKNTLTPLRDEVCDRGWSFRLLDAITRLTPRFRMPYALGASTLSVLIDDHIGAKIIYERAIKYFPNDWKILYRAAYHYLYELQDFEMSSQLFHKAGNSGAPPWVKSLASRIATQAGKIDFGIYALEDYLQSYQVDPSSSFYEGVKKRLENLYQEKGWSEEEIKTRLEKLIQNPN